MVFGFYPECQVLLSLLESSTVDVQPSVHLWMAGDIYFSMLESGPFLLFRFTLGAVVSLFRFGCAFLT